jgi:beta-lactamase class A
MRAAFALLFALALPLRGQPAQRAQLADRFRATLREIAGAADGVLGVQIVDLTSNERFGVNDTLRFPQGSAIKVPLLVELYRQAESGTLTLDTRVRVRAADQVGGTGVLSGFGDGTSELSLRDLAVLMIVLSDNTATNVLIDRVGRDRVNALTRDLGLAEIKLQRKMIQPGESMAGNENIATPGAAAAFMTRIAKCEIPVSAPRCSDLRRILEIPKSGAIPASVPGSIRVAWKPGTLEGVSTAWAIVDLPTRPYVIAAMVNYGGAGADAVVRRVADAAFAYFARLARVTPYGVRVPLGTPR